MFSQRRGASSSISTHTKPQHSIIKTLRNARQLDRNAVVDTTLAVPRCAHAVRPITRLPRPDGSTSAYLRRCWV
ncbi:hypothetical protein WAI453_001842 [Rhynchosporium graminicola]